MGLEDELKGFVKPYQGLLWRMANVINPFLTPLIDGNPIPEDRTKELEEKRKQFLALFKQLPFPREAKMIRGVNDKVYDEDLPLWHEVSYFCGDLTVYGFDYNQYSISFFLVNKSIPLDDQALSVLQRIPVPGNTLSKDFKIQFKKPIDLDWEHVEPKFSRFMPNSRYGAYRNISPYGLMEADNICTCTGYFLSNKGLEKGYPPVVGIKTGGKSSKGMGYTALQEANFHLKKLGFGELDAFIKHVGLAK